MQLNIDKKKRSSTSGSRSKSKKYTNSIRPDQTVELKPKPLHIFHNQDICAKIKTENSLNKSKGSRKNSKSLKRPEKGSIKESKDQSYLVSAQRKYSVNKINKTEATHMQSEDIYKKLYKVKKQLNKIQTPSIFSIQQIEEYFHEIKCSFGNVSLQPLQSIFHKLHSMYVTPIQFFFDMIRPYESILKKKQQISQMIRQQIQENQKLYEQLDPQDIQIIKLKQKIQKNAELIEEMKKKKKPQPNQFSMKKKASPQNTQTAKFVDLSFDQASEKRNHQEFQRKLVKQYEKTPAFQEQKKSSLIEKSSYAQKKDQKQKSPSFSDDLKKIVQKDSTQEEPRRVNLDQSPQQPQAEQESLKESEQNLDDEYLQVETPLYQQKLDHDGQNPHKMGIKSAGMSFSFKLDIPKIDRSNVGFHDEFYSKLDEFSESWRNQALRQKRF